MPGNPSREWAPLRIVVVNLRTEEFWQLLDVRRVLGHSSTSSYKALRRYEQIGPDLGSSQQLR